VALGAAIQAGVLSGESIDAILVDVIPHSLGISAVADTVFGPRPGVFSVIIPRNSVIPVSRSQAYSTTFDDQDMVEINIYQGENAIAKENVPLGSFLIENLPLRPAGDLKIEVHFDFDHNGILAVTATEQGQGQQSSLIVENAATSRLSSQDLKQSRAEIDSLFGVDLDEDIELDIDEDEDIELDEDEEDIEVVVDSEEDSTEEEEPEV
jgi:molecular chaperone DnaK